MTLDFVYTRNPTRRKDLGVCVGHVISAGAWTAAVALKATHPAALGAGPGFRLEGCLGVNVGLVNCRARGDGWESRHAWKQNVYIHLCACVHVCLFDPQQLHTARQTDSWMQ